MTKRQYIEVQVFSKGDYSRAFLLCALALANYLWFYVTNIVLARNLNVPDFDDYSVAISVVTVLSTVATIGLEKYALRCIPVYRDRGDWSHTRGFLRFSLSVIFTFAALLVVVLDVILELVFLSRHGENPIAIVVMASFLPFIAIVLFLIEVVIANNAPIGAVLIYRFQVPACFFVLVILLYVFDLPMTAVSVSLVYGAAWLLGLIAIYRLVRISTPQEVWQARPSFLKREWISHSAPLLMNSWMLTVMASSGVILLKFFYPSEAVVGIYAVVAQTGTLIVLLANTINRLYLPLMSLFLERRDSASMHRLMRHRLVVVGGLAGLFFCGVVVFGQQVLAWFGPHFPDGYFALCIIAASASISAMFSDAPYYLQFMRKTRSVFITTLCAMILNLILTTALSYYMGLLGAALGYSISMPLLFLIQRFQIFRHLSQNVIS